MRVQKLIEVLEDLPPDAQVVLPRIHEDRYIRGEHVDLHEISLGSAQVAERERGFIVAEPDAVILS